MSYGLRMFSASGVSIFNEDTKTLKTKKISVINTPGSIPLGPLNADRTFCSARATSPSIKIWAIYNSSTHSIDLTNNTGGVVSASITILSYD
jgi:hypothetical protein